MMLDVDMMLLLYLDMLLLNQDAICNMKTNEFTRENESMKNFDQTKPLLLFSKILISFSSYNQPHHHFTTAIMISPMTSHPHLT